MNETSKYVHIAKQRQIVVQHAYQTLQQRHYTFKMTSSSNTNIRIYSNSRSRDKISFIGFDWVFLAIAQMPTITCFSDVDDILKSDSLPSLGSPLRSMSFCQ